MPVRRATRKTSKSRSGPIFMIGGHEDKEGERRILRAVAEHVGRGTLLVATVASDLPDELFEDYRKAFGDLGVRVAHLSVRERNAKLDEALFRKARGVFFTGGDQLKLTSRIGGTEVLARIRALHVAGGVLAGTSAGASAMSDTMLIGGASAKSARGDRHVAMAPGLGLLRDVVVDQHFAERGRIGRLMAVVAQNPSVLALGVDENTAAVFDGDRTLSVLGESAVYVLDGREISHTTAAEGDDGRALSLFDARVHVLAHGDRYDLRTRRPLRADA